MVELENWQSENPLRKWREFSRCGQAQFAAIVGVSANSVRNWELGYSEPSPTNKALISLATRGRVARGDWAIWYESRPIPV